MPNFIKRKLLDQNEAATIQDICTVARRQMVFFEKWPSADWSRDAFNEMNSILAKNLLGGLAKLTQQQDELKQKQTDLSKRISSLNIQQTPVRTTSEATKHTTEVAKDSTIPENSKDVKTSTEDAADSIITEDVTA